MSDEINLEGLSDADALAELNALQARIDARRAGGFPVGEPSATSINSVARSMMACNRTGRSCWAEISRAGCRNARTSRRTHGSRPYRRAEVREGDTEPADPCESVHRKVDRSDSCHEG